MKASASDVLVKYVAKSSTANPRLRPAQNSAAPPKTRLPETVEDMEAQNYEMWGTEMVLAKEGCYFWQD